MPRNPNASPTSAPRAPAPAVEAPAVKQTKSSRSFVTVACKLGVSAFELQICKSVTKKENTQTGPRDVTEYIRVGETVTVRGTAYPRGTAPEGFPEKPILVGGFALTPNVPKDFWDEWLRQHHKDQIVVNRLIHAYEDLDDVKGEAVDNKKVMSGLEPLKPPKDNDVNSPDRDPRLPRSTNKAVTSPETEDARKAAISRAA